MAFGSSLDSLQASILNIARAQQEQEAQDYYRALSAAMQLRQIPAAESLQAAQLARQQDWDAIQAQERAAQLAEVKRRNDIAAQQAAAAAQYRDEYLKMLQNKQENQPIPLAEINKADTLASTGEYTLEQLLSMFPWATEAHKSRWNELINTARKKKAQEYQNAASAAEVLNAFNELGNLKNTIEKAAVEKDKFALDPNAWKNLEKSLLQHKLISGPAYNVKYSDSGFSFDHSTPRYEPAFDPAQLLDKINQELAKLQPMVDTLKKSPKIPIIPTPQGYMPAIPNPLAAAFEKQPAPKQASAPRQITLPQPIADLPLKYRQALLATAKTNALEALMQPELADPISKLPLEYQKALLAPVLTNAPAALPPGNFILAEYQQALLDAAKTNALAALAVKQLEAQQVSQQPRKPQQFIRDTTEPTPAQQAVVPPMRLSGEIYTGNLVDGKNYNIAGIIYQWDAKTHKFRKVKP